MKNLPNGSVICKKYTTIQKIGEGSFGYIYAGYHNSSKEKVAIKIEELARNGRKNETLLREAKILYELRGEKGFPKIYYYSKDETKGVLVMSLLGRSIEHLFKKCSNKFSLKTVLLLADQMISRLELLHTKGFIHRDLKPENFMTAHQKNSDTIYLIDFGLAKKYLDKNKEHIPFSEKVGLVGTARYTSIYSHLGMEQSRRDDLESLGYILIYFLKGTLPWMNLPGKTKEEKHKMIGEVKIKTKIENLCQGLPQEFLHYCNYVKSLNFADEPNYQYLKKIFRMLIVKSNFSMESDYEWLTMSKSGGGQESENSIKSLRNKVLPGAGGKGTNDPSLVNLKKKSNQLSSDRELNKSTEKINSRKQIVNASVNTSRYANPNNNTLNENIETKLDFILDKSKELSHFDMSPISGAEPSPIFNGRRKSNISRDSVVLESQTSNFLSKDNDEIARSQKTKKKQNSTSVSNKKFVFPKLDPENLSDSSMNEYHKGLKVRELIENLKKNNKLNIKHLKFKR